MFSRRVLLWGLALAAILWGVHAAQEGLRAYRRRELSQRLARALGEYEWKPIARLIRQGADPLTRGTDGLTVMSRAASLGDLATLQSVLVRAQADPLFVARELPELPGRKADATGELTEQEESLSGLVRQPGSERLLNAWLGLGLVRHRLGRYAAAAQAYRQASRLAPNLGAASDGAVNAERAAGVVAQVAPTLPAGSRVLTVAPLGGTGPAVSWGVVFYKPDDPKTGNQYARVRVGLYEARGRHLIPVGPSLPLRDPRFENAYRDVRVFAHDLTGDGKPELAIEMMSMGASWDPAYLVILSPRVGARRGGWKQLLGLTSSEPLWLEDLDGDGKYEAGKIHEIGCDMSHAEQPRWTDVYAYEGDRYVLANGRFPREFRHWPSELSQLLQAHPEDWEILDYLGRTSEILGHPSEAAGYYRRAANALLPVIAQSIDSPGYHAELLGRQLMLRKQVATLKAGR